jgi:sucrose-6-phosphate hydrolase SacC (GH32 family)
MMQPLPLVAAQFVCLLVGAAELYTEPFRLQFHYSPARNWTNDPNGLVYYEGEYHLFINTTRSATPGDT